MLLVLDGAIQYTLRISTIVHFTSHAHSRVVRWWDPAQLSSAPLTRHLSGRLSRGASTATLAGWSGPADCSQLAASAVAQPRWICIASHVFSMRSPSKVQRPPGRQRSQAATHDSARFATTGVTAAAPSPGCVGCVCGLGSSVAASARPWLPPPPPPPPPMGRR